MKITKISNLYQIVTIEYLFPCVTLLQIIVSNGSNKAFFTESFCPINCYNQCEGVMVWCILITRLLVFYGLKFAPITEWIGLWNRFVFHQLSLFLHLCLRHFMNREKMYQNLKLFRHPVWRLLEIPDSGPFGIDPVDLCQTCRNKDEQVGRVNGAKHLNLKPRLGRHWKEGIQAVGYAFKL